MKRILIIALTVCFALYNVTIDIFHNHSILDSNTSCLNPENLKHNHANYTKLINIPEVFEIQTHIHIDELCLSCIYMNIFNSDLLLNIQEKKAYKLIGSNPDFKKNIFKLNLYRSISPRSPPIS